MVIEVRAGLKINPERVDFVSFNADDEDTYYTVCVNSKLFELTKDEYDQLDINDSEAK